MPTPSATKRRDRVLIEDAAKTARKLREQPGQWFLVGVGYPDEQHSLSEVARVYAQTAYRIRCNYRPDAKGVPQGLRAFRGDESGEFEAISTADQSRPRQVAPIELHARFVPLGEPRVP